VAPLSCVQRVPTEDYVREFVEEVLRAGIVLSGLVGDLSDSLPEDAYPGESQVEVVLQMMAGTIRPVAEAAGEQFVRDAVALLGKAQDKVFTDLRLAMELARMREQQTDEQGPLN
jgi:hypothetical protein